MAIQITNGGTFANGTAGARPGLYIRFIQAAIAAIEVGSYAKVATVISAWDTTKGTAQNGKVYRVTTVAQAVKLFGDNYVDNIDRILKGGAEEVVVATTMTTPTTGVAFNYATTLALLETYEFHIFVGTTDAPDIAADAFTFMKTMLEQGKYFLLVLGYSDSEGSAATVIAEANEVKHEQVVFVGNGVVDSAGNQIPAQDYAAYVAGAIAGNGITGSITYESVPFAATITRYPNTAVKTMLAAGILVTVMDGDTVRIEQGLTLGVGEANALSKIRPIRAKQAIIMDIDAAVKENYIGQITNNEDGQIAIINAVKAYLEILVGEGVIAEEPTVMLDPNYPSTGSDLYIQVGLRFLDAVEYVMVTVNYS